MRCGGGDWAVRVAQKSPAARACFGSGRAATQGVHTDATTNLAGLVTRKPQRRVDGGLFCTVSKERMKEL